jgi:hypothetical protein
VACLGEDNKINLNQDPLTIAGELEAKNFGFVIVYKLLALTGQQAYAEQRLSDILNAHLGRKIDEHAGPELVKLYFKAQNTAALKALMDNKQLSWRTRSFACVDYANLSPLDHALETIEKMETQINLGNTFNMTRVDFGLRFKDAYEKQDKEALMTLLGETVDRNRPLSLTLAGRYHHLSKLTSALVDLGLPPDFGSIVFPFVQADLKSLREQDPSIRESDAVKIHEYLTGLCQALVPHCVNGGDLNLMLLLFQILGEGSPDYLVEGIAKMYVRDV